MICHYLDDIKSLSVPRLRIQPLAVQPARRKFLWSGGQDKDSHCYRRAIGAHQMWNLILGLFNRPETTNRDGAASPEVWLLFRLGR